MDDIITYSFTIPEQSSDSKKYLNDSKKPFSKSNWTFLREEVVYLTDIITKEGIKRNP